MLAASRAGLVRRRHISADRAAVEAASFAATAALPLETGGILLGWRSPAGIVVIAMAEVPDPDAGPTNYRLRVDAANEVLAGHLATLPLDSPVGYVGSWHSHPGRARLSPVDLRTLHQDHESQGGPVAMLVLHRPPAWRQDWWSSDGPLRPARSVQMVRTIWKEHSRAIRNSSVGPAGNSRPARRPGTSCGPQS